MKTDHTLHQEDTDMIFSKLHHHQNYYQHHQHQPSEETTNSGGGDGATIEVTRRPRGRPPGSKNKPKPPLIITRDDTSAMRPLFLELPNGLNIVESIARFSRTQNIGLSILTASGSVTNVTLCQPSGGPAVSFHGRFDILSISATFFPSSTSPPSPLSAFTVSLVGPRGQIVGGSVAGSLIAAGTVFVVAASFTNPDYHRLPSTEQDEISVGGDNQVTPSDSIYSCQMPSDVIWAPTPIRQPSHF